MLLLVRGGRERRGEEEGKRGERRKEKKGRREKRGGEEEGKEVLTKVIKLELLSHLFACLLSHLFAC